MLFYLTLNEENDVDFSPFLERDKLSGAISYLNVPLPLGVLKDVIERLDRKYTINFWGKEKRRWSQKKQLLRIVRKYYLDSDKTNLTWMEEEGPIYSEERFSQSHEKDNKPWKAFNQLVSGRQLSMGDLRVLARELRLNLEEIIKLAHYNVEQGRAQWVPSVQKHGRGWQCQRCGEKDVEEWPSFYGVAATCRSCESIGASTSLDVLYRDERSLLDHSSEVIFQPHYSLTAAQRFASQQIYEFIQGGSAEKALLWAACGAGKTEVCFPAAAWALKQGKSVLFAAPRQDVIHDIAPRLQRDFPNYPVQVLTGTTSVKFQVGGMVLATTHQVLRFWRSFDVIFMDEMDAFPYHGSRALEWGLKQAMRQGGKLLYLTATPSQGELKAVQQGVRLLVRLPARHHRNPLPVPRWVGSGDIKEPDKCLGIWADQIEELRRQGPILVFIPKISWLAPWVKCIKQRFPDWHVDGSYSADPGRASKIKKLKLGQYDIFVSTTILERGITLPAIQVVVIGADHSVFDERALVQMAGRAGRSQESPGGEVIFLSKKITPAMKTAIHWIEEQNRLALEQGLID